MRNPKTGIFDGVTRAQLLFYFLQAFLFTKDGTKMRSCPTLDCMDEKGLDFVLFESLLN